MFRDFERKHYLVVSAVRLSFNRLQATQPKMNQISGLMKTGLNNVLLPTLLKVVNITKKVVEPELACNQV